MHAEAKNWVRKCVNDTYFPAVVEFGGLDVNGSIRKDIRCGTYISVDLRSGRGVDVVADAAAWKSSVPVDLVLCLEVFEHTPDWQKIVLNAWKSLKLGGVFIVTCAGVHRFCHSALDGGELRPGEYYANLSEEHLKRALDCFSSRIVEDHEVDLYAIAEK